MTPTETREAVFAHCNEHGDVGPTSLGQALGLPPQTVHRYLKMWREENPDAAPAAPRPRKPVEAESGDEEGDGDADTGLVQVNGEYLRTLEALRDTVLEAQRLRRLLDAA